MINRAIIIVLDGFGVGELPDANTYGDEGSNTLKGIYETCKPHLPNMKKMGIYNIENIGISEKEENPIGAFGKLAEKSVGKNSPVGHWEIAGHITTPRIFNISKCISKRNDTRIYTKNRNKRNIMQ